MIRVIFEADGATALVLQDIHDERRRQVDQEGWSTDHDDKHSAGEMAVAAACYAAPDRIHWPHPKDRGIPARFANILIWPWAERWWKRKDRRRNLIRAAALLVAEIERIDRANAQVSEQSEARGDLPC